MNPVHPDSVLGCGGVPATEIAAAAGTPTYVYDAEDIRRRYRALDRALSGYPHGLHYALKANSTLAIARLLAGLGAGADANSGGELEVAVRAGFDPMSVVFTGVGKTRSELTRAVALGLKAINVESAGEADRLDEIARAQGRPARVALRLNPDVDPQSHPYITTGLRTSKFGVALEDAPALCETIAARKGLRLVGLHVHVGSQIMSVAPLRRAAEAVSGLALSLAARGVALEHLDVGGGLGIAYESTEAPGPGEYAHAIVEAVRPTGLPLLLEPGRAVVGPSGVLLTRVVDVKPQAGGKWFVIVDSGMTELMRPALYGAFHRIEPVAPRAGSDVLCDVVGPVCESSDVLGRDRPMPLPQVDDLLVVKDVGAYGSVMASNYNRRPAGAEVLVDGGSWRVIRRRQTIEDLLRCEEDG